MFVYGRKTLEEHDDIEVLPVEYCDDGLQHQLMRSLAGNGLASLQARKQQQTRRRPGGLAITATSCSMPPCWLHSRLLSQPFTTAEARVAPEPSEWHPFTESPPSPAAGHVQDLLGDLQTATQAALQEHIEANSRSNAAGSHAAVDPNEEVLQQVSFPIVHLLHPEFKSASSGQFSTLWLWAPNSAAL